MFANKRALVFLSILSLAGIPVFGQGSTTAGAPVTVACRLNDNCTSRFVDGATVLTLADRGIVIRVSLTGMKRFTVADVSVTNGSASDLNVMPATFQLVQAANGKTSNALPLAAVLKTEGRRDNTWGNFFDMGTSATKQETKVVTKHKEVSDLTQSNDGRQADERKVVQVTVPDEDARAAARAKIAERKEALNGDLAGMRQTYLQSNTVAPGTDINGAVYFAPSRVGDELTLVVPLASSVYRFTLTAQALE